MNWQKQINYPAFPRLTRALAVTRLLGIVPIWARSLIDRGHMTYSLS